MNIKNETRRQKKLRQKRIKICSVCGGFKYKCKLYGHIKTIRPKHDDLLQRPEEEPGYGHGV